jgi:hypothetical protein
MLIVFTRIKIVPRVVFKKEIPRCANKVKVKLALEQTMEAQRRHSGVPLPFI